jgi:hypothetical protein
MIIDMARHMIGHDSKHTTLDMTHGLYLPYPT